MAKKKDDKAEQKAVAHLKQDNKDCIKENKEHNELIKRLQKDMRPGK
jgi:hypothetical protein